MRSLLEDVFQLGLLCDLLPPPTPPPGTTACLLTAASTRHTHHEPATSLTPCTLLHPAHHRS